MILSALQMLQGFTLYAAGAGLTALAYDSVRHLFPFFAAVLVTGGVIHLLVFRYALNRAVRSLLMLLPLFPIVAWAWIYWETGFWTVSVHRMALALVVLALPWLPEGEDGIELAPRVLGLIQGAIGLSWVVTPVGFWTVGLLAQPAGLVMLAGAASLLLPRSATDPFRIPGWLRRALPILVLLGLLGWSVSVALWTESLAWALWLVAFVLADWIPRPLTAADRMANPDETALLNRDLALESWNWLLIAMVVLLAALPDAVPVTPLRAVILVAALSAYFTTLYLILPQRRLAGVRVLTHLVFMAVAMGFLVVGSGLLRPGLLTLLVLAAPLATWASGPVVGHRMLWLSALLLTFAEVTHYLEGDHTWQVLVGSLLVELLVTLVAGRIGIRLVVTQQGLVGALKQSQLAVDQANRELGKRNAQLQDAVQNLQASNEELMAQEERMHELNHALLRSEARMVSLLAIAPNAIVAVDDSQRIVLFNREAEKVFGFTEEEALGQMLDILLPIPILASHRGEVERFGRNGSAGRPMGERRELTGRRKNGETFPTQIAISKVTVGSESIYMAIVQDVSQQRATERLLKESEERFRSAFENAPIGVGLLSERGIWLQVNRALLEMIGYGEEEVIGRAIDQFTHIDDWDVDHGAFLQLVSGQVRSLQNDKRFRHKNGATVWVQQSYSVMRDHAGQVYFIIQVQDITERRRYESKLVHMANYDPLTELVNRRRFHEELENQLALSRRFNLKGALFLMDLDLFKYVNDTLGHQQGDEVLRRVAHLLREYARETDIVARLGGDEFALLLPCTTQDEAVDLAERVLDGLRHTTVAAGGAAIALTASVGIAFFPDHGDTADDLLAFADVAMYEAKESGRNGWSVFEPNGGKKREMESKLAWERRIREALQQDRLVLHYQPILDLRRNRITHHELLLRMVGEDGELIYPNSFLGVAERFNLIQTIDRWVVKNAIRLVAAHQREGIGRTFEVNLSGKSLADPELLPMIQQELVLTGIDPSSLVFEITETAAIGDIDQARSFIDTMKAMGFRFALDDVGAGFSSLYFLKHLAVDYVKIDGSFIRNLPHDQADQHLVRALVTVSRELGKETVAEFVDSEETLKLLREYGVDYAQGYLIGKPAAGMQ